MQVESNTYRTIPGFESYGVSTDGQVFAYLRKRVLIHEVTWQGYHRVHIYRSDRKKPRKMKVARLVLLAYVGLPPTDEHVPNHKNGIKGDDRLENLEWATRAENVAHAQRTGLLKGSGPGKLTMEKARAIRLLSQWHSNHKIAVLFGVTDSMVGEVVNGNCWKEKEPPPGQSSF